jgi:hypothetical protein
MSPPLGGALFFRSVKERVEIIIYMKLSYLSDIAGGGSI